jgi:hypothetical protein
MSKIVRFGDFSFHADPIFAAHDSAAPGQLMGYRLKGPRGSKHIITVDHQTGKPDAHQMASLALWVDYVNYGTAKIAKRKAEKAEKRRIDRKVFSGKATRKEVLRGLDLLRKSRRLETEAA